MVLAVAGYALMVVFFGLEFFIRKETQAKLIKAGPSDRGTTILIAIAYNTSVLLSPLLNYLGIGRVPQPGWVGPEGIGLMTLGLGVRLWAMLTLGQFYTRTLRITDGQPIVEGGPYRVIRHPGYLGTLLIWVGLPLALSNWLSATLVTILMAVAYRTRIRAEEAMLLEAFGDEYLHYMERTARFLPFIL
jgi:protein-S-isoprenylcysteine O-methyltransferase